MKHLIIIIFISFQMFSQNEDSIKVVKMKEYALIKVGGGLYLSVMSSIFVSKSINNTPAFYYTNIGALQLNLLGIFQFAKARKLEKKLNKHYKIKLQ